jgi:hypothetical protein
LPVSEGADLVEGIASTGPWLRVAAAGGVVDPDTLERFYRRIDDPELRTALDRLIKLAYITCEKTREPRTVDPQTGDVVYDDEYYLECRDYLIEQLTDEINGLSQWGESNIISLYTPQDERAARASQSAKEAFIRTNYIRQARKIMGLEADEKRLAKWQAEYGDEGSD